MLRGGRIMGIPRTQKTVSPLSTEPEYIAMADPVKGILLAQQMWAFMRPRVKLESVKLFEDSEGAIYLDNNPMESARSKHIGNRHYSMSGVVEDRDIRIVHVNSQLQRADMLTNYLGGAAFRRHCRYEVHSTE